LVLAEVAVDLGHLFAAGIAPSGEKIQYDQFLTDVVGKPECLAAICLKFEVRSDLPAPVGAAGHVLRDLLYVCLARVRLRKIVEHAKDRARQKDRDFQCGFVHMTPRWRRSIRVDTRQRAFDQMSDVFGNRSEVQVLRDSYGMEMQSTFIGGAGYAACRDKRTVRTLSMKQASFLGFQVLINAVIVHVGTGTPTGNCPYLTATLPIES